MGQLRSVDAGSLMVNFEKSDSGLNATFYSVEQRKKRIRRGNPLFCGRKPAASNPERKQQ
jgi:hypothetical protein